MPLHNQFTVPVPVSCSPAAGGLRGPSGAWLGVTACGAALREVCAGQELVCLALWGTVHVSWGHVWRSRLDTGGDVLVVAALLGLRRCCVWPGEKSGLELSHTCMGELKSWDLHSLSKQKDEIWQRGIGFLSVILLCGQHWAKQGAPVNAWAVFYLCTWMNCKTHLQLVKTAASKADCFLFWQYTSSWKNICLNKKK